MGREVEHSFGEWVFEYGGYDVEIGMSVLYGFVSQQFLAFGAGDTEAYHLVVDVGADSIDSNNSIENGGIAQVLVEPDVPNFSVSC